MIEIYRSRKPIICPSCGFRPVARIVYGLPKNPEFNEYERKLYDEEEAGRVVSWGCLITLFVFQSVEHTFTVYYHSFVVGKI